MGENGNGKDTRLWERDDSTPAGLRPSFRLSCPMCRRGLRRGTALQVSIGNIFSFSVSVPPDQKAEKDNSFAEDVWLWCPRCGYSVVHGVPLSEQEFIAKKASIIDAMRRSGILNEEETIEIL